MKEILVIDDDIDIRSLVKRILNKEGYRVIEAADGFSGVKMLKNERPDLILCDIIMPGLDGFGVLQKLYENSNKDFVPMIFITAKSSKDDYRHAMELGANDYLIKPFTRKELLCSIEAQLKKQIIMENLSNLKLNELRKNITFSLPHEFYNPITGIVGLSKVLIDNYNTMDRIKILETLKIINSCGKKLYRLSNNFLLYVKLELTNKDSKYIKDFTQTKKAIEQESIKIAKRENRLDDLVFDIEECTVKIFEQYFRKIIEETIDNAFKFSKHGSKVKINGKNNKEYYDIKIIDNGNGMTEKEIDNIGAYMQFGRKINEQQGSGLGLAIVKRIIELYDGELLIESIYKQQTLINIKLPVSDKILNNFH